MLVYCAANCDTAVEVQVIDLGAGAGRVACLECSGDGEWSKFAPDIVPSRMKCPDCKGSGYQLASV
jgi:DnaJ-class molecular chaperone